MSVIGLTTEPSLVLCGIEEVREAIARSARAEWLELPDQYAFKIKSDWLITIVAEIVTRQGIAYNAQVKKRAEEMLGMSPQNEAYYAKEGDTLSLLVYNAQCFYRQERDRAREAAEAAQGWIRPTEEWLASRVGDRLEVMGAKKPGRVCLYEGRPAIRPYRAKNTVYSLQSERLKVRPVQGA